MLCGIVDSQYDFYIVSLFRFVFARHERVRIRVRVLALGF